MNPIAWVQGLNGTTLIVVICVLMFIEETGVPCLLHPVTWSWPSRALPSPAVE